MKTLRFFRGFVAACAIGGFVLLFSCGCGAMQQVIISLDGIEKRESLGPGGYHSVVKTTKTTDKQVTKEIVAPTSTPVPAEEGETSEEPVTE